MSSTSSPAVQSAIQLRPWQRAAFDRFAAHDGPDFLAVATPGAGKTTFALTCARWALGQERRRLVVVAPTSHLKLQWAQAAHRLGLELDPDWTPSGGLARDVHGLVTTYQHIATAGTAKVLRGLATDAFVILDEIHHAGDERAWGDSVRLAFDTAHRRLCLSGTPFRSDTASIPFVQYQGTAEGDAAAADYTYGYADALRDGGVVRPVYFPRFDGVMEWSAPDGSLLSASFADELTRDLMAQRLRTALSLDGDWLPVRPPPGARAADGHPLGAGRPAGGRWARHRHGPGARPGHRPAASAATSVCRPRWWSATIRPRPSRSPRSPPTPALAGRGADGAARASTSPACGSGSTPPR